MTSPCPSSSAMRAEKPPSQSVFLTVSDDDAARAADADQLVEALDADMAGGEDAGRDDAGEMAVGERQRTAERKSVKGLVGAFLGGLGEHAFRDVQRLDMRIAHDIKPFADQAGAGAGVEQRRRAARQVARQQRQADRRMAVSGDRHFLVVGLATSCRRAPRPLRRPSLHRPRRALRHAFRQPSPSSRCVFRIIAKGQILWNGRDEEKTGVGRIHER